MPRERGGEEVALEAIDDRLLHILEAAGGGLSHAGGPLRTVAGKSSSSIVDPEESAIACSIACSSSRTFARPRVGEERAIRGRRERGA